MQRAPTRTPAAFSTATTASLLLAVALIPALGPRAQADDADDRLAIRVGVLVRGLESTVGATRREAGDRLAKLGAEVVPHLIFHLPLAGELGSELELRRVFTQIGTDRVLGMLLGHRTRWQYGDPDTLALLVEELWLEHRERAAERARLAWSRLEDPSVVPRDLVVRIDASLPESLAGREVEVVVRGGSLLVPTGEGPRDLVTLTGRQPRVLELGTDELPRPVVVWKLSDQWYVAPASTASCVVRGEEVMLLDGDLDGRLRGPVDRVRIGTGGFQPLRHGSLSWLGDMPVRLDVARGEDGSLALDATPLPLPAGLDSGQREAIAAVNRWRRDIGLSAQLPELPHCEACALHARYYEANGFSGHHEDVARPGYTAAGARAGQASCCSPSSRPMEMVHDFARTILHRCCLVTDGDEPAGLGIGSAGGCIWSGPVARPPPPFVLVPSPGQRDVPRTCEPETPSSDSEPTLYDHPRGYPISVSMHSGLRALKDAVIELHALDRPATRVEGFIFSPSRPYSSRFAANKSSIHFVAKRPLRGETTYCVRLSARRDGSPLEVVWTFTTR